MPDENYWTGWTIRQAFSCGRTYIWPEFYSTRSSAIEAYNKEFNFLGRKYDEQRRKGLVRAVKVILQEADW